MHKVSHIICTLLMLGAAMSCNKAAQRAERNDGGLSIEAGTKSADFDMSVYTALAYSNGSLAGYVTSATSPLRLELSDGTLYDWKLIGNLSLAPKSDVAAFASYECRLEDNTVKSPVLYAEGSDYPGESINATITPLPCLLTLKTIDISQLRSLYASSVVTLKDIYIRNAVTRRHLTLAPETPAGRCNANGLDASLPAALSPLVLKTYNTVFGPSDTIDASCALLSFPDPAANSVKMVVEIDIDGDVIPYEIPLPSMTCGCEYIVNRLDITGGSDEDSRMQFVINSIVGWNPQEWAPAI